MNTLLIVLAVITAIHILGTILMYRYCRKTFGEVGKLTAQRINDVDHAVNDRADNISDTMCGIINAVQKHERFYRKRVKRLCPVCSKFDLHHNRPHVCTGPANSDG